MSDPVLLQFRYSHYNEKARWALDFKGVRHVRRSLLPGPHMLPVLLRSGQRAVPVLMVDGTAIADSTRIIEAVEQRWPDPPLYPRDESARRRALELEEYFDEELGPHARRTWFHVMLPATDFASAQLTVEFPSLSRRVYRALFPVTRTIMVRDMKIHSPHVEASQAKVDAALERLEAELQPSGYLVGDHFTVADLTAAALLSPLVTPAEFPYPFLTPLPAAAAAYRDAYAGRRAFQWVQEMYRRHRGTSAAV